MPIPLCFLMFSSPDHKYVNTIKVDQVHFIMNSKSLTNISTPLMILSSIEHLGKFIDHFTEIANVASDA